MASRQLAGIARKLILAEKRISRIETVKRQFQVYPSFNVPAPHPVMPKPIPFAPLDLGKLNEFISDNAVSAIECSGAGKNIMIRKEQQMIETNVQLDESEISAIIEKFSKASGIPQSPIMKAIYSNLTFNAFIFPTLGNKFFILKS
jgi:hypothetical protein